MGQFYVFWSSVGGIYNFFLFPFYVIINFEQ